MIAISWLHLGLAMCGVAIVIITTAWLVAWLLGLTD